MQSTMSEAFHDWLEQCPCSWTRLSNNSGSGCESAQYEFVETSEEIEN